MSRDLDTATAAHSQGAVVRPVLLVELDYPDGMVRCCSADQSITWSGQTYLAVGAMGAVSAVQEGTEAQSYGVTLSLSGVPGRWGRYLIDQQVQGRSAVIRLAFLNAGCQLIGEPLPVFVGRMDTQDISVGEDTSVQVALESLLVDWERNCSRRYTDVDQRARCPTDRGLEYVAATANAEFHWGG
jgi:hypothetical protein